MWHVRLRRWVCLASVVALVPWSAVAQTDEERAGARALAQQGAEAFDKGQWQQAVDLFERAESVVHAPPHVLYIARCEEKLGHLVEAQEAYIKISRESLAADAPKAFRDAKADAERELTALEARVPSVTVIVTGPGADSAEATVDDTPIPKAFIGVKRPTNPGKRVYSATAPGASAASVTLEVQEGANETVTLELVPVETQPAAPVVAAVAPAAPPLRELDSGETQPRYRIPMYASFGAGAIGVIGGTVFLIKRSSDQSDADDQWNACVRSLDCDSSDESAIHSKDQSAARAGTLAIVGYGLGIAGIGAGVAFWLLDRKHAAESAAADSAPHVSPWVGVGAIGIDGSF